jgi:hypothetical protein
MRFNARDRIFSRIELSPIGNSRLQARIATIAFCMSSWLLAGSAFAAAPMVASGNVPTPQPQALQLHSPKFRATDGDVLQAGGSLTSRLFRANGARHRSGQREFRNPSGAFSALATTRPLDLSVDVAAVAPPSGAFRFERHNGAVVREIPRGYNRMCDALSAHIWSRPQGKRLCFDMRGKPGIAIQIPIH